MKHSAGRVSRQRGQASVEYIVVTSAILAGLIWSGGILLDPTNDSPISQLANGFKSFFSAYSFTLSLP